MIDAIGWAYAGFILGIVFHKWIAVSGYEQSFWEGFTFKFLWQ